DLPGIGLTIAAGVGAIARSAASWILLPQAGRCARLHRDAEAGKTNDAKRRRQKGHPHFTTSLADPHSSLYELDKVGIAQSGVANRIKFRFDAAKPVQGASRAASVSSASACATAARRMAPRPGSPNRRSTATRRSPGP